MGARQWRQCFFPCSTNRSADGRNKGVWTEWTRPLAPWPLPVSSVLSYKMPHTRRWHGRVTMSAHRGKKDPLLLSLSASVGEWDTEQDNKVRDSSHSFPFSCTAASGEISVSPSFGTQPDISLPPHLHPPTFYLHSKVALYLPFIKGVQMWPPCNLMPLFSTVLTDWEGRKNRAVGLAEDL